jgi:hypothetical protein
LDLLRQKGELNTKQKYIIAVHQIFNFIFSFTASPYSNAHQDKIIAINIQMKYFKETRMSDIKGIFFFYLCLLYFI